MGLYNISSRNLSKINVQRQHVAQRKPSPKTNKLREQYSALWHEFFLCVVGTKSVQHVFKLPQH